VKPIKTAIYFHLNTHCIGGELFANAHQSAANNEKHPDLEIRVEASHSTVISA